MSHPLHSLTKRLWRLRRSPVLARRRGAIFLLDPQNWIDNRLLAGAPYENAQIASAQRLIRAHALDLVLDIGANFGLYSILLGKMEEVREAIAFEPVRRNHAQLLGNIFANRLEGKIEARRLGLSDRAGPATIHIDPSSTGVSRLDLAAAERDPKVYRESERIELAPLDDRLVVTGRRAFVKIDVEGQAAAVIAGMKNFLATNICALQIEIADATEETVRRTLEILDYAATDAVDRDVIFLASALRKPA